MSACARPSARSTSACAGAPPYGSTSARSTGACTTPSTPPTAPPTPTTPSRSGPRRATATSSSTVRTRPRPERREGGANVDQTHEPAISIAGLSKSYGDKVVLDGIDLDVAEGT